MTINDERLWKFCRNLYENQFEKDQLDCHQWRFLLAFMIELLIDDDRAEKRDENQRMISDLCQKLSSNIDPIRKKYWQFIQEQQQQMVK